MYVFVMKSVEFHNFENVRYYTAQLLNATSMDLFLGVGAYLSLHLGYE